MKHLPARTCGYRNQTCVGIQFNPIQNNISCTGQQNFYGLPQKFLSVVPQVDFINLSDAKMGFQLCTASYQPFQQGGLFDAFAVLSNKIEPQQCYMSDSVQRPGILLPTPQLTAFQPVSALAVPTQAISSINNIKKAITNIRIGVKSGCTKGFVIVCHGKRRVKGKGNVKLGRIGANEFRFYVSGGQVSISYPGGGQTLLVDELLSEALHQTTIFIVVQQDILQQYPSFTGKLIAGEAIEKYTGKKHTWIIQLGTIKIQSAIIDVVQTLCSPIQLNIDWVRPDEEEQSFVWTWKAYADEPQWLPVKDCG